MRGIKMRKKFLVLAMCLGVVMAAAGCGSTKGGDNSNPSTTAEATSGEDVAQLDYSAGLTDEGYFDGINPADYIELGEYKGIELKSSDITPSDEDIQEQIDSLLQQYPIENEITDRAVEDGDTLNIDYVGKVDGVEFDGGSQTDQTVTIGVTSYIDDFLEQLIGHNPGETFDIEVTFPDEYPNNPDLAGKDAVFTVTINKIIEEEEAVFDDAFVQANVEGYETADEYRQYLYDSLLTMNKKNTVWSVITENTKFNEYPEEAVQNLIDQQNDYYTQVATMWGYSLEEYIAAMGSTEDDFKTQIEENAKQKVGQYLIAQSIAETEKLELDAADSEKYIGTEEDVEEAVSYYGQGYVNQFLLLQKAADYVVENAVIVD